MRVSILAITAVLLVGCVPHKPPVVVPTPPPVACVVINEADLVAVKDVAPTMTQAILDAEKKLGDMTGQPWHEVLEALAVQLNKDGHCAIAGIEAIFIRQATGALVEEFHAVASATGGWVAQGKYMGAHREGPAVTGLSERAASPVYLPPVRSENGVWMRDGKPFWLVGAIPCWPTDGTDEKLIVDGVQIPYMWPLVSPEWIRHVKTKGANAVHVRPGPLGIEDTVAELKQIGGPYNIDGTWNDKFWAAFRTGGNVAGEEGFVIQVGVLDGWALKNAIGGAWHFPTWPAEHVHGAQSLPINESVKKWTFKVVYESCNWGNAIYEIGNESDLTGVWTKEWERAMYALIREAEDQEGCKAIVHMIGSNTRDYEGPYDYFASHYTDGATEPKSGRPSMVNEYNPSISPGQFKTLTCNAKKIGQSFWYWRSDGSDAVQDESLNLLKTGCEVEAVCPSPQPDRAKLGFNLSVKQNGVVDATPLNTKDVAYCTSIGMPYGPDGVTPRGACPMRNECPGFDCENRLPCEQYAMSVPGVCTATAPTWVSDGEVVLEDQFGFRARCNGCTYLKACNCDATRCEEVRF